ncbi:hypothetical protein Leryth_003643 [Lithospermum erythrorhizon]|nr:hypothetical protein Leryth_003643 [Lithospermum erythrorhizon]
MAIQVIKEEMVNKCSSECESYVGIGPLGGSSGTKWMFKAKSNVEQIIIHHGDVVDSLIFICENGQSSDKFGSNGGNKAEVYFQYPHEYLTGISGTIGTYHGDETVKSLAFHTNVTTYGPFGRGRGGTFTLPVEDGVIVGFHGRSGPFLNAIGLYIRPKSPVSPSKLIAQPELSLGATEDFFPRNPGPFGGSYGRDWDDGVFSGITKVVVNVNDEVNVIQSVEFEYVSAKHEGGYILSPEHGGSHPVKQIIINIDHPDEFLMGIAGYYDFVEWNGANEAIRSIKFMTNKGVYGPYGKEIGTCFASPAASGKIVGFYGRAAAYLTAIGVHMEYI